MYSGIQITLRSLITAVVEKLALNQKFQNKITYHTQTEDLISMVVGTQNDWANGEASYHRK
jgi:hypothetical protein